MGVRPAGAMNAHNKAAYLEEAELARGVALTRLPDGASATG